MVELKELCRLWMAETKQKKKVMRTVLRPEWRVEDVAVWLRSLGARFDDIAARSEAVGVTGTFLLAMVSPEQLRKIG